MTKYVVLIILSLFRIHCYSQEHMIGVDIGGKTLLVDLHEVTYEQYKSVFKKHKNNNKCNQCPVDNVTYEDAIKYCAFIGKRLPTQAEFEYLARGGIIDYWEMLNRDEKLEYAWFQNNAHRKTHPVMTKKPNPLGLYDMMGNVWEWTADSDLDIHPNLSAGLVGFIFKTAEKTAIIKGGGIDDGIRNMRTYDKDNPDIDTESDDIGFRCVQGIK